MSSATSDPTNLPDGDLDEEQVGYKQSLSRRHVQMIAIGGAIGTGLFLGSASRLHSTGPRCCSATPSSASSPIC